jgi:uncharacterized membrane protein
VSAFGVRFVIPVDEDWPGTIIAVNLGGALLPLVLSAYLSHQVGHVLKLALVALLVAAVTHHFARIEPGIGGVVPVIVPPAAAALLAWFIAPEVRAAAAFVGGTIGTLVGADLLNLRGMRNSGAAVASIGGAGTYDGIFITGIVAVPLA